MKWFWIGMILCLLALAISRLMPAKYSRQARFYPEWKRKFLTGVVFGFVTMGITSMLYWIYLISGAMDRLMDIPG